MFCSQSSEHTHHGSSSASVKTDSDKATIGDPASPPNTSGKIKVSISSLMVPAFSFVARCWFNNPRPPDLRTWVKGVSSADLLHEVKHAETHTLAMGLLDLVFTKHKQARNIVTTCKPQRKDIGILPTDRIHTIRCQNQRMEEEKA